MFKSFYDKWNHIPNAVKLFLFKAVSILIIWKAIYLVFLLPTRVIDAPATYSVGVATAKALNLLNNSQGYTSKKEIADIPSEFGLISVNQQAIYLNKEKIVAIEDACNGVELFVLYTGFILCLPAFWLRKVTFILMGLVAIYFVNIFRCTIITWILLNHPRLFSFAHHYLFTFIVYVFIIWFWMLFTKKLTPQYATKQ
ncbi:MAG: hypothetical protein JWQ25_1697 [Daejeonella sp.]|nr:hypothetical protein [Daejeonella sp.]